MPHILITDDDPHLRRLVRTYAELEGFECTEAGDGAAAVTALKQSAFDLVLLDVMMPKLDGFETLEAIRGFSQVPVIMLTARNEEYDKLNGFLLAAPGSMQHHLSQRSWPLADFLFFRIPGSSH